jgi:transaldolase/glucose-6-phosphate isomerase
MTVTTGYQLGAHQAAVDARLRQWDAAGFGRRLWDKDPTLWAEPDTPEISDRLGWLELPWKMATRLDELEAFRAEVAAEAFRHVVVLGMGGSSLAPEVFQATFGNDAGQPELLVLDSTHPAAVRAVEAAADPATTLYLVASKSGGTLETMSFARYFWARVADLRPDPGAQFVAITDPGSSLETLAGERSFRRTFLADSDVGGRYSALTYFGLVPAAAIGVDLGALQSSAADMADACGRDRTAAENPGLVLGAALGELALAGKDKVTFLPAPALGAFPAWLEQLIAESTGKDGTGIVPIGGEPVTAPDDYDPDRVFVTIAVGDDHPGGADLAQAGHPVIDVVLDRPADLGGAMYLWEVATASAGAALEIHPFNQPDVQIAKTLAKEAMAGESRGAATDEVPADDPLLGARLADLMATLDHGDYVGIHAYLEPTDEARATLQEARLAVRDSRHAATTLDFGPRFLHSTGQLHKGGPNTGVFVQVIDHPAPHVEVPETDYDFGKLISAQAMGDLGALEDRGRRVLTVCLGDDVAGGLKAVRDALTAAARA